MRASGGRMDSELERERERERERGRDSTEAVGAMASVSYASYLLSPQFSS
jgi:hypothetical protein